MNAKNVAKEENCGEQLESSGAPVSSSTNESNTEIMKRAAAKHLIERYYYQLTNGCGRRDCTNNVCRSCPDFIMKDMSADTAAVRAIELFINKANLCDTSSKPLKKSKNNSPETKLSVNNDGIKSSESLLLPVASCSKVITEIPTELSPTDQFIHLQYMTEENITEIIEFCQAKGLWSCLNNFIYAMYSNSDCLINSFNVTTDSLTKEDLRAMETDEKDIDEQERVSIAMDQDDLGSNPSTKFNSLDENLYLNLEALRNSYKKLFSIHDTPFMTHLINAIIYLCRNLELDIRWNKHNVHDYSYLRIFIIIMELPVIDSMELINVATPLFCKCMGYLPLEAQGKLSRILSKFSSSDLRKYVERLQQLITYKVVSRDPLRLSVNADDGITGATKVMKIIYYASILGGRRDSDQLLEQEKQLNTNGEKTIQELMQSSIMHLPKEQREPKLDPLERFLNVSFLDCRDPLVPWTDFINEPLSDAIELERDYSNFSFMKHPFILTTAAKNLGMYYENRLQMINERRPSILALLQGDMSYLRLRIRRDHIVDDALASLETAMENPQDLKKQLFVEFEGEQGIDQGGVSKEFFQLVIEELFNPDFGMFTYDEETNTFWINSTSFENEAQFLLIGIVLGLAIYNTVILDVHFPLVMYRKLIGKVGTFDDLKSSHPTLAKSLQDLIDYEGDVEETFMQTYCISYKDVFGTVIYHDLKENGSSIPVTTENRKEFVDMYADYLLNHSVGNQFIALKKGFQMVTDDSPLKTLFRPEEVELLVCGSNQLDFQALEFATSYDGGFTTLSPTVKNFWEIVHGMSDEEKRRLLQFATGSDRVPVGGLAKLKLIINRNGPDSDRLPTSHTCFNVLLLPDYSTKEKLRERLLKAITYAKGFGML